MAVKRTCFILACVGLTAVMDSPSATGQSRPPRGDEKTLFISQIVLCKGVRGREPVGIVESFTEADSRGICYLRVYNTKASTHVSFRWFYEDSLYSTLKVKVGLSKVWRTYSSVRLKPGLWRVEVVDKDDKLMEGIAFRVHRLDETEAPPRG